VSHAYHRNIATDATNQLVETSEEESLRVRSLRERWVDVHRPRYQQIREEKIPTIPLLNSGNNLEGAGRHRRQLSRKEWRLVA